MASHITKDNRLWIVFLLGFSSGLPFLLILSTLSVRLMEAGLTKTQIGLFAWASVPYTLKFVLAPLIDNHRIPISCHILGQRRGWLIFSQVCLIFLIVLLGHADPFRNIFYTACCAFLVGLFSAIQDIVTEAYRIEILENKHIGIGASASVLGYRVGMLLSGAGAIYLAAIFSWQISYHCMAILLIGGLVVTLVAKEPTQIKKRLDVSAPRWLERTIMEPLQMLYKKNHLGVVIGFILLFKFADSILNVMSIPFLIEIGFSKVEIAHVAKIFGISLMIVGGVIGGVFLAKYTVYKLLLCCGVLQCIACLLFLFQSKVGHDVGLLFFTMGMENFTCGMSQVALVAYFSQLCSLNYAATHYALISSFASFARVNLSSLGGWLADHITWGHFYTLIALSSIVTIIFLRYYFEHFLFISSQREKLINLSLEDSVT